MKQVSFKTANAIKEAGYPQVCQRYQYSYEGELVDLVRDGGICYGPVAPTYLEIWLWLWRDKGFRFELAHPEYKGEYDFNKLYCNITSGRGVTDDYSDPEEAIIAAIEYLVDNDLIK